MRRAMRISALVGLITVALATMGQAADKAAKAAKAKEPAKIQVLVITGDDVGVHPWREMSEATRDALVAAGKFNVKVCEDPLILESAAALKAYDVIVFMIYDRSHKDLSDQAKENLLSFVKDGKGFMVQHLASASYPAWAEFGKLCGRRWVMGTSGHGPRSTFTAKIADKEQPMTKGLEDFQTDDELYSKLQGDEPIHVLVESYSDWSKKTEPLFFFHEYGKGRAVYNAFGHDGKALATPSVRKLIDRGVEWAATGKVSAGKVSAGK
jgi:uncharacterized protein